MPPLPDGAGNVYPHRGEYYYSKPGELPATEDDKETGTETPAAEAEQTEPETEEQGET